MTHTQDLLISMRTARAMLLEKPSNARREAYNLAFLNWHLGSRAALKEILKKPRNSV